MRLTCLCFLIVAMLPMSGFAQSPGPPQQRDVSYDLWLVRSQKITEDLIKDSAALIPSERSLLWARLAQRWWQNDPEKAHAWMLKPIELVEAVPNRENPEERSQRLTTARLLLRIVGPLDQKLSARLVAVLKQNAEEERTSQRSANADGLIQAAVLLLDNDPKRAFDLGLLALRVGPPTHIDSLLWPLLRRDSKLAEAFFTQALAKAREVPDGSFLFSLLATVFPEYFTLGYTPGGLVTTDFMRREILKAYVVNMQANRIDEENRGSPCMRVISIAPALPELDRLLPQQAVIVRQSINQCQSLSPLGRQRVDEALREQPLNTVDALLKAADDAQDMKVRTIYQFRAATLARQQNDHDRALKILDTMSVESREFMGGTWESVRWDWAASAALNHLTTGDVGGMRLIINAVPDDLRPFAKIALVDRLPVARDKDTDPTLEFLSDVRTALRRSSVSDVEKPSWYFALLKLIVKYQPPEAIAVLKEAIAALNHAEPDPKSTNHDDHTWFNGSEIFSAPLLEMDEYAVREAVSSISSVDIRVQVRLEMLRVCLQRLGSAKQATPRQRPS